MLALCKRKGVSRRLRLGIQSPSKHCQGRASTQSSGAIPAVLRQVIDKACHSGEKDWCEANAWQTEFKEREKKKGRQAKEDVELSGRELNPGLSRDKAGY